jgi:hypothetical protein
LQNNDFLSKQSASLKKMKETIRIAGISQSEKCT